MKRRPSFDAIWIHHQRAIPVDWNFATAWQRDVGTDFDLHFAHRNARPGQEGLQSKGWDNFATIIKKQRNARVSFIRQVDVTDCEKSVANPRRVDAESQ